MNKKRILHWIIIEESNDCTTFEGSLQSKMSQIIFDWKNLGMLKCNRNRNNIRGISAVLHQEVNLIRNYMPRSCGF